MKIGIISDIHAYLKPLDIALDIFMREKVDQVVCAGDLVDGGEDVNAVVQRIKSLSIPCVQGNHDSVVLDEPWWADEEEIEGDPYSKYRLTDDSREFIGSLPPKLQFEWEGKRIYLTHGAPWDNWEYIFPYSRVGLIRQVTNEAASDIVILGHTHTPMQVHCQDTILLNGGSVAYNRDNTRDGSCAVLEIPDFRFQIFDLTTGKSRTLVPVII